MILHECLQEVGCLINRWSLSSHAHEAILVESLIVRAGTIRRAIAKVLNRDTLATIWVVARAKERFCRWARFSSHRGHRSCSSRFKIGSVQLNSSVWSLRLTVMWSWLWLELALDEMILCESDVNFERTSC